MQDYSYIGVDVSKDTLQIAYKTEKGTWSDTSIENTLVGINNWLDQLAFSSPFFILEYTGTYSAPLVYCLSLREIPYYQLTCTQSKGFMQSLRSTTKTDKSDARNLCSYGIRERPAANTLPSLDLRHKKQLLHLLSSLKETKREYENRKHALSYDPQANKDVLQIIEDFVSDADAKIEKLAKILFDETNNNEDIAHIKELILSVKGIGEQSAQALIIATNGFRGFKNAKQVSSFLGVSPCNRQSGSSVRRGGHITKTAAEEVRRCLYMGARSALKHNKACKVLYERLRSAGKGYKVAVVAVMHKLVKQAFAVVKNNTYFDNDFEEKTA